MRLKIYKLGVATLLGVALTTSLGAQTLNDYRKSLEFGGSGNPSNKAQITIREDNSARIALTDLAARSHKSLVDGYRIGVYFDNGASARANAMKVVEQCKKYFGDIPVTMTYDNPYFKVSAGYCIDDEEAIMMLNRIQEQFPKAYLMREQISPADLVTAYKHELIAPKTSASDDDYVEVKMDDVIESL